MLKPYLVIFKKDGLYKSFDCITIDEALALTDRKDFGDLICTYNLSTDSVMHVDDPLNGIDERAYKIIDQYKRFSRGYDGELKALMDGANMGPTYPVKLIDSDEPNYIVTEDVYQKMIDDLNDHADQLLINSGLTPYKSR